MNYDNILIKLFFTKENKLNLNILAKYKKNVKYHNSWPALQYYINNRYNDSNTLKETLYRILYNIEVRPVCKACGKPVEFIGKGGRMFRDYCCNSCSANSKETTNKKKQTQLKNWGTENCYDSEKYQQHLLKTRGAKFIYDLPGVKEKRKQTLIEHYGTDKITSLKEIQEKISKSYIEKYGVEHPMKLLEVRNKIKNTCLSKYGVENAMQSDELLRGFKISGIHYGYSHFNPLIIKKFLKDNNASICYDPCGGWGHRILGSIDIDKYIYNDLSYHTYMQCKTMCKTLNINNVEFYNKDANIFVPDDNFDVMFTCPPYYNIEEYECDGFESIEEYNDFLDNLFNIFYKKESCQIFGLVIREDLINENKYKYCQKIQLNNSTFVMLTFSVYIMAS